MTEGAPARGKRANGEGTAIRSHQVARADGSTRTEWYAAITLNGQRYWRRGPTQRAVRDKLAVLRGRHAAGKPPGEDRQTVLEFLTRWLADVAASTVAPSTFASYTELVRNHLGPGIGHTRLTRLGAQELQTFYRRELERGFSPQTVGNAHRVLHRALRDAVAWDLVPRNVADLARAPRVPRQERPIWTVAQVRQFLASVRGNRHEALYVLGMTTGMRPGELLALHWADLDFAAGAVQVRRKVRRIAGQGNVESQTKTVKSNRLLVLAPLALDALRAHRSRQIELRLAAGPDWVERDLIFAGATGGHLSANSFQRDQWRRRCVAAGLPPIRFYDAARHGAASLLLAAGIHPKVVSELLGHATVALTLDRYSHVLPSLTGEAAAAMQRLLGDA